MLSVLYELRQAGTKQTDSLKIDVLTSCSACCLCLVFLGICSPLCLSLSFSLLFCHTSSVFLSLFYFVTTLLCLSVFPSLFCQPPLSFFPSFILSLHLLCLSFSLWLIVLNAFVQQVFQRRQNGTVNLYQNLADYMFWLGIQSLYFEALKNRQRYMKVTTSH